MSTQSSLLIKKQWRWCPHQLDEFAERYAYLPSH